VHLFCAGGGIPLENYVVEKFDKDAGIWIPVGKTKDTEMDVEGLVQGHEYSFRVKAQNVRLFFQGFISHFNSIFFNTEIFLIHYLIKLERR